MKVLALGAHPGDLEIFVFGALLAWKAQGARLALAIATDGAAGGQQPPEALLVTRRAEADSATGYELLARSFPPGTVNPTTVLVERSDGTIRGGDLAAVVQRLEQVPGVATVQDSGRRSTDAHVAELLAVFADDPLDQPAIDRIATMREHPTWSARWHSLPQSGPCKASAWRPSHGMSPNLRPMRWSDWGVSRACASMAMPIPCERRSDSA